MSHTVSKDKVDKKKIDQEPFLTVFSKSKQQYTPVIFPHGIKVSLSSSLYNNGIVLEPGVTPSSTTYKLYNEGGTLKFNGLPIGSGGGGAGGLWTEASDGKIYVTGSAGVGISSAPKTALVVVQDYVTTTFETQLSAGEGGGEILKYGTGTTAAGKLYYLNTSAAWTASDSSSPATGASQLLGIGLGTDPAVDGMLLKGYVRVASADITGTANPGLPLYVSPTASTYNFTTPSAAGEFVRVVGYCVDTHSGDVLLYFNPDSTWVEIS